MKIKHTLRNNGLKIALPLLLVSPVTVADWADEMDVYVGAGIGQSYLTPPTGSGNSIDDDTGDAWKLTAGVDLTDNISVEGYYADLGHAELDSGNDVDFSMQGLDAIFHYWAKGEERAEGSVALYAKAGVNYINTESYYKRDDSANIMVGLGAEMYLPHNFSVRLEGEKYYADADLFSVNLVKRFGFRSNESSQQSAQEATRKLAQQSAEEAKQSAEEAKQKKADELAKQKKAMAEEVAKATPVNPVLVDVDGDGVADDIDQCLGTTKGSNVDANGCAVYSGAVGESISSEELQFDASDIQFNVNSATPTAASKAALDKVAKVLTNYGTLNVEVQAHSDSSGAAAYNKTLSQKRADAVVAYLTEKGIDASRLTSVGYGEEKPIADNATAAGRTKNRRVEFVVLAK